MCSVRRRNLHLNVLQSDIHAGSKHKTIYFACNISILSYLRSKKGVDSTTLSAKTGFDKKKIANIVFKLRKLGKIKSAGRGVYMKA